jgi:hypothetical protein
MSGKRFFYYGLGFFVAALVWLMFAYWLVAHARSIGDRARANVEQAGRLIQEAKDHCKPASEAPARPARRLEPLT